MFHYRSQEEFSNCTIVDIPVDYRKQGLAFAYPLDSPLLEAFNHVIKQMSERGTLKKIKENYAVRPQVSYFCIFIFISFLYFFSLFRFVRIRVVKPWT